MKNTRSRSSMVAITVVTIVAAMVGSACSDDSEKSSSSTIEQTDDKSDDAAATEINVKALDYKYDGLPSDVTTGTKFTLSNESDSELHEMVVFRVKDGETRIG